MKFRRSCPIKPVWLAGLLLASWMPGVLTELGAWEGQLQVTPYYDSNAGETIQSPVGTPGIRVRTSAGNSYRWGPLRLNGSLFLQGFGNIRAEEESKLILLPELHITYQLLPGVSLLGSLSHFRKSHYGSNKSYRWSEYTAAIQHPFNPQFTGWLEFISRGTTTQFRTKYHYLASELQAGCRYAFHRQLSLNGSLSLLRIEHKDYRAWDLTDQGQLIRLSDHQKDIGAACNLHLQYRDQVIAGLHSGVESMQSNSVIGSYTQFLLRGYLTGHIGRSTFYHVVLQVTQKNYRYPQYQVARWYLDPESSVQNRAHFRLERLSGAHLRWHLQVSSLQNESILLNRYYDKVLIEVGGTYDW
ncbi:MAG TPA: hypothetical protein VKA68_14085 [bacterium]|nr:hypothetical protein [bacterium]